MTAFTCSIPCPSPRWPARTARARPSSHRRAGRFAATASDRMSACPRADAERRTRCMCALLRRCRVDAVRLHGLPAGDAEVHLVAVARDAQGLVIGGGVMALASSVDATAIAVLRVRSDPAGPIRRRISGQFTRGSSDFAGVTLEICVADGCQCLGRCRRNSIGDDRRTVWACAGIQRYSACDWTFGRAGQTRNGELECSSATGRTVRTVTGQ